MEESGMNVKETLRYLGYHGQEADSLVLALVEQCWQELERISSPKSVYQEYPLRFFEEDGIDGYGFRTHSRALRRNLDGCMQVILFAATLGSGVDTLLLRYNRLQMSKAVVFQAAAAAMLEDYCDQVNEEIRKEYEKKGLFLRPRFSPGYGDFSLDCQPALLQCLEAGKRVGITLTDSLLMAPSKSVTALIGISDQPGMRERKTCQACEKKGCAYRENMSENMSRKNT